MIHPHGMDMIAICTEHARMWRRLINEAPGRHTPQKWLTEWAEKVGACRECR